MRNWVWPALAAIVITGAVATAVARRWPAIHDISTDVDDPPPFVAVLPHRTGRVSPAEYDGPTAAAQQRHAYPDVQPLTLSSPPAAAFACAAALAHDSGWQIVAEDRDAGRIEAIAATRVLRFKDDVVIRIRQAGSGSRVDMRSKSRVGVGDLGTNARRIRTFLGALRRRCGQ